MTMEQDGTVQDGTPAEPVRVTETDAAGVPLASTAEIELPKLKRLTVLQVARLRDGWRGEMIAHIIGALDGSSQEGFCGRDALDRRVPEDGPYIHAAWARAQRKPSSSLVKARTDEECVREAALRGLKRVGKGTRREIKARVTDALAAEAQWSLKALRVVLPLNLEVGSHIYTDAMSDGDLNRLTAALANHGIVTHEVLASSLWQSNLKEWRAPAWLDKGFMTPGHEFLIWAAHEGLMINDVTWSVWKPMKLSDGSGHVEEIKTVDQICHTVARALAKGRAIERLQMHFACGAAVTLTTAARAAAIKWTVRGGEPELCGDAARAVHDAVANMLRAYLLERCDEERWAAESARIGQWIEEYGRD